MLPVQYASLCHAAFSRIQSVVIVFIVLSQLVICLKPTVQCIFNSLTILLIKYYRYNMLLHAMLPSAEFKVLLMYSLFCLKLSFAFKPTVQQFDNLINQVLPVQYASSCHAAFSRIQSVVNVFIVLSQVVICF